MSKMIVVDPIECAGCRTCEMACSMVHHGACSPALSNMRVVEWVRLGITVPMTCLQCEDPICMKACKTGALTRNTVTGAMIINQDVCVGCKMCMLVCPVGAPHYSVAAGKMEKCDLCDGDPACVKLCPTGAIKYVDVEDIPGHKKREGASLLVSDILMKLKEYNPIAQA